MSDDKEESKKAFDLGEFIHECRPSLSDGSVKTYKNVLKNLYSSIFGSDEFSPGRLFSEYIKVLKFLNTVKFNVRKTILSALICISNGQKAHIIKKYRDLMIDDCEKYNHLEAQHKLTPEQKEAWMTWPDIIKLVDKLKLKVNYIFDEANPSKKELLNLQEYIIALCYTMMPPRRSTDWTQMKLKNFERSADNYYNKGIFYFNKFKNSKVIGSKSIECPPVFKRILTKWIKIIGDREFLFNTSDDKALTSVNMTKILNNVFKKRISVNMLRHIYLSSAFGPELKKMEKIASEMSHSLSQQKLYIKFD